MSDNYKVVAIGVDQFIIFTNQDKDFWVVQHNDTVIYEGVYPPPPQVFRDLTNEDHNITVVILTEQQIEELLND